MIQTFRVIYSLPSFLSLHVKKYIIVVQYIIDVTRVILIIVILYALILSAQGDRNIVLQKIQVNNRKYIIFVIPIIM